MLTPDDRHLTEDEIELLAVISTPGESNSTEVGKSEESSTRHLSGCRDCQEQLSRRKAAADKLKSLKAESPNRRGDSCPPDEEWMNVAAGIVEATVSRRLLDHAASCDYCGPILRRASEDFANELTPNEQVALGDLESGTLDWQQALAARLANFAHGNSKQNKPPTLAWTRLFRLPRFAILAGTCAVAALILWLGLRFWQPLSPERLLAQAYTENRIMELRIDGASYAPLRQERGATGSALDQPQALLDANALISRQLRTHPDEPKWLLARARADLLEFRYEPAIKTLQRVLDLQPNSPGVKIDLASAYYQRALSNSDRAVDYGTAIEYLGRALAEKPDDPLALFNRAIAEEKLHLYTPAIDDWNHYLRIDPTGPWSEEARRRLEAVENKLRNKESSLRKPLLGDVDLALLPLSIQLSELQGRVEEYLHAAVKEWLPRAFPLTAQTTNSVQTRDSQAALGALAEVTRAQHRDSWLTDLLKGPHGKRFESGVTLLSGAVQANDKGDYAEGRNAAHAASKLFRSAGNLAAELRAQVEEVYSDHLLYDGRSCMTLVHSLHPQLQQHDYEWLRAESDLEESNCAGLTGDLGREHEAIEHGTDEAEKHEYLALFLRGTGFQADAAASLGDTQQGFSIASRGLEVFWSSQLDVMKGYNLYTDMDTAADIMRLPNLQVALWHQATTLIDLHPDLVQRAMAHRWYANSAYLANMPRLAAVEFAKASDLFAAAPSSAATARGEMDADIWLAGLEARQGDLDQAAARLQKVQGNLERAPSFGTEIGFYTTLADLRLRSKDSSAAESALRSSIYLAEWALRTFPTESARRQWAKQTEHAYRNLVIWKLRQRDPRSALELWEWYKGAEFRAAKNNTSWPSDTLAAC